uniref:Uncharacterized protein n=1 Tax=viral metagenome TaxID=1070528 RepID=A0A6C0IY95_9ZZZZ
MTTVNPTVVLKYIFKNQSKKESLDLFSLYSNMYEVFLNYKADVQFLDFIKELIKDFPDIPDISNVNLLENDKNLPESVYMIYTNLLRYFFNKQTDILKHFQQIDLNSKENHLDLSKNIYIYKWIYIYGNLNVKSKEYNYLEFRNKFLKGTLIYFNVLINQFTYLKTIVNDNDFEAISSIENIRLLEDAIVEKIFKDKCNYIDSSIDSNLISTILGVPIRLALEIDFFTNFSSYQEFIDYKINLQEKILKQNKTVFNDTVSNNFIKSINTECKFLGTILTKYVNTFIFQHSKNIKDIYLILSKYKDMSDERYSVKLKKFKEYYLENSFINL